MNHLKYARRPLLAAVLFAGCQGSPSTTAPSSTNIDDGPNQLSVGPARRVNLIQHAVLAFRPQGDGLVGGYRTHQAEIRDGIIQLTPYTFDSGERRAHAPMTLNDRIKTVAKTGRLTQSAASHCMSALHKT